jgi:uncharacterized repeat protein (TIGR01451 family)
LAALVVACIAATTLTVLPGSRPAAAAERSFGLRYSFNGWGNVEQAGNSQLTCLAADPRCAGAQSGGNVNNNVLDMRWIDVDGDPGTFNSTSARVQVPPGAAIDYAALYWGGDTGENPRGAAHCNSIDTPVTVAPNPALAGTVRVKVGAAGYVAVSSDTFDDQLLPLGGRAYQGFADITPLLAGYAQPAALTPVEVTVADLQLAQGMNCAGGWSIVLVYTYPTGADPAVSPNPTYAPSYRNISLFDGFRNISSSSPPQTITLDGFLTPASGPVDAYLGVVAYEGDRATAGDKLALNGTALPNAGGSANNFFDATVAGSTFAAAMPAVGPVDPVYANALGYDSKAFAVAEGLVPHNATSASVQFTTNGDAYRAGAFVFTARIHPLADVTKSVTRTASGEDAEHKPVRPGERLTFTVVVRNIGDGALGQAVLKDTVDSELVPVPQTITLDGAALTDAADGDAGERTGQNYAVRLGQLPLGATRTIRFDVTVSRTAVPDVPLVNRARLEYRLGQALFTLSSQTDVLPAGVIADLTIVPELLGVPPVISVGRTTPKIFTVTNKGPSTATGIVVTDLLPAGLTYVSGGGNGWTCTPAVDGVRCTLDGLAPGATAPPLVLVVLVNPGATGTVANMATVSSGEYDPDSSGNSTTLTIRVGLPPTGASLIRPVLAGAGLIGLGTLLLLAVRRTRRSM